ncbi:MAG: DNA polymerase I [Clostridiales bacterium]|jgi:DNA polymerase-1|nr:DNA polymerase I [Clostridiales bacterium]
MIKNDLLVLIDGNSLLNRAYYALPPLITKAGEYTHAVYGFCTMLAKVLTELNPAKLIVAFDMAAPTFRKQLYTDYKAQRKKMPDELACQLPILKGLLADMGVKVVEREGVEADDVLGTLTKIMGMKNVIVTGDRDAFQLINDCATVWLTKRGITDVAVYDEAALLRDYGITPRQVVDMKSLMGDASDNIPGVEGVGEKTAVALIQKYGSLDGVYANLAEFTGKLKERLETGREKAYLSYELATIKTDVDLSDCRLSDCNAPFPFRVELKERFARLEFNSLVRRDALYEGYEGGEGEAGGGAGTSGSPAPLEKKAAPVTVTEIAKQEALAEIAASSGGLGAEVAVWFGAEAVGLSFAPDAEYRIKLSRDLLSMGMDLSEAVYLLRPVFENPALVKTVFCVKDTLHMLAGYGATLVNGFDLQLAQYVIDYSVPHDSAEALLDRYGESAGAAQLLRIAADLKSSLSVGSLNELYGMELKLSEVLFDMETRGFQIDMSAISDLSSKYLSEINRLVETIYELSGERFNLNSPKQLAHILFEKLKLTPPTKNKSGWSTSADILAALTGEHPVVEQILRYRTVFKLYSTYIEGLRRVADSEGVVRTSFKQAVTSTGRLSSAEPNLQNIPVRTDEGRELRRLFRARPGNILIAADYSQIELRLLAHFSGEPRLIEAYMNGADIHRETAAKIFHVALELVTPEMRRAAKAVNFGVIYGISGFGLSQDLSIGRKQAQNFINAYFETYPKVKEYMDANVAFAKKNGYISTFTGRTRRIFELRSPKASVRNFGERAAMNMPLQGSAADLIKLAMIRVDGAYKSAGLKARLILQIHDELIVESPESERDAAAEILKREMESAAVFKVPLIADVGIGYTWYDC